MKFLQCIKNGKRLLGVLTREETAFYDVSQVLGKTWNEMIPFIQGVSKEELATLQRAAESGCAFASIGLCNVQLLAPIERPIHDIICVGVNYRDHLEEARESAVGFEGTPKKPVYFGKRAIRILGSGESIRGQLELDEGLDYEVELAVIIGKGGTNIAREQAEGHIFGYSVFNDLSSRGLQKSHVQWYRGKSLDTYSAMGPVILHKSSLPFPVQVEVSSTVNGETRQRSNTQLLLADLPSLIADLSAGMTLEAGDVIATGTPAGVGMGFQPPRYLKRGDQVVCEIPEIGKLVNTVE